MKKIFFIIIIQCIMLPLTAQTLDKAELQKYWYYRERLKSFVKVSNNANEAMTEAGTNIPAAQIYDNGKTMKWDDGNGALGHYISVLATEYRLLKNYHQDYSRSARELYYALLSLNRLDATGEYYYREPNFSSNEDLNGFFVRDDITLDFENKYIKNYFNADKIEVTLPLKNPIKGRNFESSEDNCYHYMEALALVNVLVDNETVDGTSVNFKQMAKDITRRMVDHLYHKDLSENFTINANLWKYDFNSIELWYDWYAKNPVTGKLVLQGNGITGDDGKTDGTMLYLSHGFALAANNILGTDTYHGMKLQTVIIDPSAFAFVIPHSGELFGAMLDAPCTDLELNLYWVGEACISYLGVPFAITNFRLYLDGSNFHSMLYDGISKPKYCYCEEESNLVVREIYSIAQDDYRIRSLCATGNISHGGNNPYQILIRKQKENPIFKYEHLPLLWSVLNNNTSYITAEDRQIILNLLASAPKCGPYYFSASDNGGDWSCTSRLIWPDFLRGGDQGEFNGLDYMLLHNLYWLTNPVSIPKNRNPMVLLPALHKKPGIYTVAATNDIVTSQSITLTSENEPIEIYAGNSIELRPGFEVNGTGEVTLNISEVTTTDEPIYFHRISLNGYNTCASRLK